MRNIGFTTLPILLLVTALFAHAQDAKRTHVAQRSRSFIQTVGRDAVERISIEKPFAHYKLDGNVMDESENKLHGYNAEAKPTLDRFGKSDSALKFDGVNDFLTLPIDINPDRMKQLTMCVWIKPDTNSGYRVLLTHDDGKFDRAITMEDRNGRRYWYSYGGAKERITVETDINYGEWYFVAVCYDQEKETVRFYVNGESIGAQARTGGGYPQIRVGMDIYSVTFFRGAMDDIRIYDTVLSAEAIEQLYELKTE